MFQVLRKKKKTLPKVSEDKINAKILGKKAEIDSQGNKIFLLIRICVQLLIPCWETLIFSFSCWSSDLNFFPIWFFSLQKALCIHNLGVFIIPEDSITLWLVHILLILFCVLSYRYFPRSISLYLTLKASFFP